MHPRLISLSHYKQLSCAILCNSIFNIDYKTINALNTVIQIQKFWHELKITDKIIDVVIKQISQYRFYIDGNIYLNNLNLLQCIDAYRHQYNYNIFYDASAYSAPGEKIKIDKYLKCFGGGITRGVGNMDFRLLPLEHFEIWLKILEKDYVSNSRTFAAYKKTYTMEYQMAKSMRESYVDATTYVLEPHSILHEYKNAELKSAHAQLKEETDKCAEENAELKKQIKKLKKYIKEANL